MEMHGFDLPALPVIGNQTDVILRRNRRFNFCGKTVFFTRVDPDQFFRFHLPGASQHFRCGIFPHIVPACGAFRRSNQILRIRIYSSQKKQEQTKLQFHIFHLYFMTSLHPVSSRDRPPERSSKRYSPRGRSRGTGFRNSNVPPASSAGI